MHQKYRNKNKNKNKNSVIESQFQIFVSQNELNGHLLKEDRIKYFGRYFISEI